MPPIRSVVGVLLALVLPVKAFADEPGAVRAQPTPDRAQPAPAAAGTARAPAHAPAPVRAAAEPMPAERPGATPAPPAPAPPREGESATPRPAATGSRELALRKLASSDAAAVQSAIDTLVAIGGPSAQQALASRLRGGLPPQLSERTIAALVQLKARQATPVLIEIMQHRRDGLRLHALGALIELAPRGASAAENAVIAALADPSLEVRTRAAQAVPGMRLRRAVPALLAAYDRGLSAALPAIGALAGPGNVDALLARARDGVLDPLLPAFDVVLQRSDFPQKDKLALIAKLGNIGSPSAQRYLVALVERYRAGQDARLAQAIGAALEHSSAQAEAAAPQGAARPTETPTPAAQRPGNP